MSTQEGVAPAPDAGGHGQRSGQRRRRTKSGGLSSALPSEAAKSISASPGTARSDEVIDGRHGVIAKNISYFDDRWRHRGAKKRGDRSADRSSRRGAGCSAERHSDAGADHRRDERAPHHSGLINLSTNNRFGIFGRKKKHLATTTTMTTTTTITTTDEGHKENCGRASEMNSAENVNKTKSLDHSSAPLVRRVTLSKSPDEPFGLFIQGGIDSPYILAGEERTALLVKDVKAGSAADRTGVVRIGDEILKLNGADLRGKTHQEIVGLIGSAGNSMDLEVVIQDIKDDKACLNAGVPAKGPRGISGLEPFNFTRNSAGSTLELHREDLERKLEELKRLSGEGPEPLAEDSASCERENESRNNTFFDATTTRGTLKTTSLDAARIPPNLSSSGAAILRPATTTKFNSRKETLKESSSASPPTSASASASTSKPRLMWGVFKSHVSQSKPPNEAASAEAASLSTTPSPYHIPTPSPNKTWPSTGERAATATPYPVIYPRLPGDEIDVAGTPPPPEVGVATLAAEAAKRSPYERPLTSWSINDPTERGGNETDEDTAHSAVAPRARRRTPRPPVVDGKQRSNWDPEAEAEELLELEATRREGREEDHVYLFVGTLALVVAAAILGSFLVKNFKF